MANRLKPAHVIDTITLFVLLSRAIGDEFVPEPASFGSKPFVASGEYLHRPPRADTFIRRTRASGAERRRRLLPNVQFQGMARFFPSGASSREH